MVRWGGEAQEEEEEEEDKEEEAEEEERKEEEEKEGEEEEEAGRRLTRAGPCLAILYLYYYERRDILWNIAWAQGKSQGRSPRVLLRAQAIFHRICRLEL